MLHLRFDLARTASPWVLCLGAHSDDIEIGCGGTILQLVAQYPELRFYWIVFSASPARALEATASAANFLRGAGGCEVVVKSFRDGYLPYEGAAIKDCFEELKVLDPALVLTHYREDLHQDHRVISELSWNTFRDHLILEYEIPKYDGGLGSPNFFMPLAQSIATRKLDLLMAHFQTQGNKHWFARDTFAGLMRLRGIESRAPDGLAEGLYMRKAVLSSTDVTNGEIGWHFEAQSVQP